MMHAVVTGGGSGIGAAIALRLVAADYRVSIMGRRLQPLQEIVAASTNAEQMQALSCDVSDATSVETAFSTATATFGPVDVLVNSAGQAPTAPFHKLTAEEWNRIIGVNLNGVFNCCAAVIDTMRSANRGHIINIASTASLKGYAYVAAYCAAKHGVLGLTRALALETATRGITVNAICPGYTDTGIVREGVATIVAKTGRTEAQALSEFTGANPQGRLIEPDEIADTALWLCSPAARSITGQAISISGGEI